MPRRFNGAPLKSTDRLNQDTLNPLFVKLDAAVAALEEVKLEWDQQVLLFNTNALKRVTEAIKPLVDQLNTAIDGGFLVAQTDDLVHVVEGEEISFFIPEGARIAFRPTPFLAILAPDDRNDWAIGRLLAYSDSTGLLTAEILHLNGSGAERTGWTIAASSGVVEAVYQWMTEAKEARDATVSAAEQALTDIGTAGAAILESAGAARDAAVEAAEQTNAAAILIAGGPVSSVNGRFGVVTGLAEAADVANALATRDTAIGLKADAAATTTALGLKADAATTYSKTEVDTAVNGAKLQIGDILYTLRNPGSNYLALNGGTYLQSAYVALTAALAIAVPQWAPSQISNPGTLPPSTGNSCAWSPSGRYLAVGSNSSPYITIYDWNTGVPVKISDPAILPAGGVEGVCWSPDGRYLVCAHATTPFVTIYDWNTGSPVKISNPAQLPTGNGLQAAWSPSGRYLAVYHATAPGLTIYDWNTGTPVKISNPASLPTPNGEGGVAWSPDSRYLVVAHSAGALFTIYDWISGSPVKISDPATVPSSGYGTAAGWSPSGRYMVICVTVAPYLFIYDWNTGSPVKISDPALMPTQIVWGVTWSSDSRYMALSASNGYLFIYDWQTGTPVRFVGAAYLPGTGYGAAWRPDKRYLATVHTLTPFVSIFDGFSSLGYNPYTEFKLPNSANGYVRKA